MHRAPRLSARRATERRPCAPIPLLPSGRVREKACWTRAASRGPPEGGSDRVARSRRARSLPAAAAEALPCKRLPGIVVVFLIALALPWFFHVASLRLAPYRIVLLLTLVPTLIAWLSGKCGQIRLPDIALILYSVWCTLSLFVIHGAGPALQSGAILFVETSGAYLFARCYVRDAEDFRNCIEVMFRIVACLLPFAIVKSVTGRDILLDAFRLVMPAHPYHYMEPRWGLRRVQSIYEHPILFGVSTGCILAPDPRRSRLRQDRREAIREIRHRRRDGPDVDVGPTDPAPSSRRSSFCRGIVSFATIPIDGACS